MLRAQTRDAIHQKTQDALTAASSLSPTDSPDLSSSALPDAPLPADESNSGGAPQASAVAVAEAAFRASGQGPHPCSVIGAMKVIHIEPNLTKPVKNPCAELIVPYQRFLDTEVVTPLSWQQKGYLALHNSTDPANFATIVGISGITIASDSHTAYGPGFEAFGSIAAISLLQDATGQFFGVFAVPALIHQDPRYFRRPEERFVRRFLYCISRTAISRNDDGEPMPNYATFSTYAVTAELANLYVPGIHPNGEATVARIATGLATDPVNNLINEFLPDVAKRIHVRIIFVQTLLNNISGSTSGVGLQ